MSFNRTWNINTSIISGDTISLKTISINRFYRINIYSRIICCFSVCVGSSICISCNNANGNTIIANINTWIAVIYIWSATCDSTTSYTVTINFYWTNRYTTRCTSKFFFFIYLSFYWSDTYTYTVLYCNSASFHTILLFILTINTTTNLNITDIYTISVSCSNSSTDNNTMTISSGNTIGWNTSSSWNTTNLYSSTTCGWYLANHMYCWTTTLRCYFTTNVYIVWLTSITIIIYNIFIYNIFIYV